MEPLHTISGSRPLRTAWLTMWLTVIWMCLTGAAAAPYSNPIVSTNLDNPFITFYEGYYYFLASNDPDGPQSEILITRATTLEGLKTGQTKSIFHPSSTLDSYTSPELHFIDGVWWIYYSRFDAKWDTNTYESIAVLKGGTAVRDPFTYVGLLTNTTLSNDPTILQLANQRYMVYKCRTSPVNQDVSYSICIAPMVSPTELGRTEVLTRATEAWETPHDQAFGAMLGSPAVLNRAGKTFITYSLDFNSVLFGMLAYKGSGDPMSASSWVKTGPHQSVAYHPTPNATCHASDNKFFLSPDETEIWSVYSVNERSAECRDNRYVGAKMIGWNSDGSPDFSIPGLLNERQMGPSGE
ncbi:hypothetical protein QBC47DRAFT_2222 [Echria macrotheca]|uniref:Glycoside hydrolase family 43 protein n=1 Tax=Echria macrotheca TaxID=438768 RepID=A0AAJ0BKZ0_9PEZI|nr:hypothetical protein QBC47DRAFT_2222 [Echria macrotheca]